MKHKRKLINKYLDQFYYSKIGPKYIFYDLPENKPRYTWNYDSDTYVSISEIHGNKKFTLWSNKQYVHADQVQSFWADEDKPEQ